MPPLAGLGMYPVPDPSPSGASGLGDEGAAGDCSVGGET
jgi:hypothetical protein